ncbi:MAG: hypothetical protein GXY05_13750 [Clostridiales bacterium]|nr:hypothetical protein [Clostridiales bacterium]
MKHCRTVNGLTKALKNNVPAELNVWSSRIDGIWAEGDGIIHLNLGGGRYAMVSRETYEKIRLHLNISTP